MINLFNNIKLKMINDTQIKLLSNTYYLKLLIVIYILIALGNFVASIYQNKKWSSIFVDY